MPDGDLVVLGIGGTAQAAPAVSWLGRSHSRIEVLCCPTDQSTLPCPLQVLSEEAPHHGRK